MGWPLENIVLHGSSIGCAPASRIASKTPGLGGLVLQGSMPDMCVLATNWIDAPKAIKCVIKSLVGRRWRVDRETMHCKCPVLWIHGKKDKQLPYTGTMAMYDKFA